MKRKDIITPIQKKFIKTLCELTDRDRFVLQLRHCSKKSLHEIAEMIGISHERVRQLEKRSLKLIEKIMK